MCCSVCSAPLYISARLQLGQSIQSAALMNPLQSAESRRRLHPSTGLRVITIYSGPRRRTDGRRDGGTGGRGDGGTEGRRDGEINDRLPGRLIKHVPNDSHVAMNMHHGDGAEGVGVALFTPHPAPHLPPSLPLSLC